MSRIINWGIIGPGKIANRFASAFSPFPEAKLYAVASRDIAKAKEFAQTYSITTCYDNYEALVNDPNVDVIYIATPHSFHHEQTLLCLKHKKAVLCEKPLTINHRLAKEMVNAARESNTFLMEAMWSRFFPTTIKAKQLIEQGAIGEVKYMRADFGFKGPYDPKSRLYDLALGGGAMLDVGVYPLFLSLYILGKPKEIKASVQLASTGADQTTNAIFTYADGSMANILSSIVIDTPKDAEIIGTEGTITIHTPWHKSMAITVKKTDGEEQRIDLPYEGNGFEYQVEEVMKCLQNNQKESFLMPLDFSLMMAEVSDEVRRQCGIKYPEDH
ncbi:MAG TPA: Gfo/Idh/MocA family oxidoreductase [Cyclobacteriaceae bacterium]